MTARDLPLACECGELRGTVRDVAPPVGLRLVCHCKSCRESAIRLGHGARLDVAAGVDIFQTSQGRIVLTQGQDRLACRKLTPKGPLRWHARCCGAPLLSTLDRPWLPVAGIVTGCLKPGPERALDDLLGPVRFRVFGRFAEGGPVRPKPGESGMAGLLLRFAPLMLRARRNGDHRRTPFFDAASGRPVVAPEAAAPAR